MPYIVERNGLYLASDGEGGLIYVRTIKDAGVFDDYETARESGAWESRSPFYVIEIDQHGHVIKRFPEDCYEQ